MRSSFLRKKMLLAPKSSPPDTVIKTTPKPCSRTADQLCLPSAVMLGLFLRWLCRLGGRGSIHGRNTARKPSWARCGEKEWGGGGVGAALPYQYTMQ